MSELVEFETIGKESSIGVARLCRVKPLNSLLLDTIDELGEQLYPWMEDDSIKCIILDSASDRAFCAGADITALYHAIGRGDLEYCDAFFTREYRLDYALQTTEKPILVWGHGIVMGGGLGLLGGCSLRVGTLDTRIAMPEITIGLFPDAGGTAFLSAMPDGLGYFAGLTGCQLSAGDGLAMGMLDHVVDADAKQALFDAVSEIQWQDNAETNRKVLDDVVSRFKTKQVLSQNLLRHRDAVADLVTSALASDDFIAVFDSGLSNLGDDEWLGQAISTYQSGSPTTARLFVEQMRRAYGMSLADMFRMELLIACQCARHPDFPEGVRALMVDKDRNPRWQFSRAGDVPDDVIAAHFEPSWAGEHPLADLGEA